MTALAGLAAVLALVSAQREQEGAGALVFSSDRDGPLQLYRYDLDDGSVRRLTDGPGDARHPSVSPDATRIVFQSVADRRSDLFVLELEGGGLTRLTSSGRESEPAFAPDGRIAFTSRRDGDSAIYLMEADGSRSIRLSPADASDRSPTFSPDGRRIAFVSRVDGDAELFVMNADGKGRRRLTFRPGDDSLPSWSPDGRWLVFGSSSTGKHDDIYRIGSEGGVARALTESGSLRGDYIDRNRTSWGARISPDGRYVAFASVREGNAELYLVRADGTGLRRLTDDPAQDLSPAWLPAAGSAGD